MPLLCCKSGWCESPSYRLLNGSRRVCERWKGEAERFWCWISCTNKFQAPRNWESSTGEGRWVLRVMRGRGSLLDGASGDGGGGSAGDVHLIEGLLDDYLNVLDILFAARSCRCLDTFEQEELVESGLCFFGAGLEFSSLRWNFLTRMMLELDSYSSSWCLYILIFSLSLSSDS